MEEIQLTEERLKKAQAAWEQANEALRQLTRMDTDTTIARTLTKAREARHQLARAHKNFIDAHRWRLGR